MLEGTLRACLARGDATIGTEHLLISLLHTDDALAASTLAALDVDPDDVRFRIEHILAGRDRRSVLGLGPIGVLGYVKARQQRSVAPIERNVG